MNRRMMKRRFPVRLGAASPQAGRVNDGGDPALVKADWLTPQSYDVRVTSLRNPFNAKSAALQNAGIPNTGPIRSNEIPFRLVAGVARLITTGNRNRKALMMQNLDPIDNLFYSFSVKATAFTSFLTPGQYVLLDFVCPIDSVWAFATANISGFYREMAPGAE